MRLVHSAEPEVDSPDKPARPVDCTIDQIVDAWLAEHALDESAIIHDLRLRLAVLGEH